MFPFITSSESFFLLIFIIMTKLSVHLYLLISLYLMVLSVKRELGDASDPSAPVIPMNGAFMAKLLNTEHLSPGFKAHLVVWQKLFCPLMSGAKSVFNSENFKPFIKCHMTSFYFNLNIHIIYFWHTSQTSFSCRFSFSLESFLWKNSNKQRTVVAAYLSLADSKN